MLLSSNHVLNDSQPMSVAYLDTLNPEQRRAVEHGVREKTCAPCAPLLVIAGAGSGKTNTLAHRVAHLIVNGADPRRILLMTFSRRAATEMTRRVERIARQVMGDRAGVMTDALTWVAFFAGIWTRWTSVRKVKEGEMTNDVFAFLTTEPNKMVGAIHSKAMPVILATREEIDTWMTALPEEALTLQRPLADDALMIVARGEKKDQGGFAV